MKNWFKFLGIIVFVTLIIFSIVGCKTDDDSNGTTDNSGGDALWSKINETSWVNNGGAYIKFYQSVGRRIDYRFPSGDSEYKANAEGINSIKGSKIEAGGGWSFNVSISGETMTISNWSIPEHATAMNGVYTKE